MSFIFKKIVLFIILSIFFIKPSLAEVTFQEILENPSDIEINLKYAKEQEALGRYKATITTLERLNMLYPVNTDLKLYLISILLKLDSESKLQLMIETMLQDPNTTDETREYIEGILENIRQESEPKGRWFAYADLNYMQTDHSNIDGSSKSGFLWFNDRKNRMAKMVYDKTYSRGASFTIGKNLNATSALSFNGGLSINTQNKGIENESDLSYGSLSYSKILGKHYILPYISYSRPNERNEADLNSKGLGFNNTYILDKTKNITYGSSYTTTSYNRTPAIEENNPDFANNEVYTANIGYNHSFLEDNLISSKLSFIRKKAKANYFGYEGNGINIGYTRILPFGNLRIDTDYQFNDYDEKQTTRNSTIIRRDDVETSQIQLSGRVNQLLPFIKNLDQKSKIYYTFKHVEIDSESTLIGYSAIRKQTSFSITKRFTLYE